MFSAPHVDLLQVLQCVRCGWHGVGGVVTQIDGASNDVRAALIVDLRQGKHAGDALTAGLCSIS